MTLLAPDGDGEGGGDGGAGGGERDKRAERGGVCRTEGVVGRASRRGLGGFGVYN